MHAGVIAAICAHQGLTHVCIGMWTTFCSWLKDDNIELAGLRISRYLLVKNTQLWWFPTQSAHHLGTNCVCSVYNYIMCMLVYDTGCICVREGGSRDGGDYVWACVHVCVHTRRQINIPLECHLTTL